MVFNYCEVTGMRTVQRLTDAYNNARIEYFCSSSKYIFLSDSHRGNGGLSDEFIKNQKTFLHALNYYYRNGFTYVEAGDGDELWEHPHYRHVINAHYEVFDAIKRFHDSGRLIMLYGNHNMYLKDPVYVEKNLYTYYNEFLDTTVDALKDIKPCEALLLKNRETGQEILTVHGHQGDLPNDQIWRFSMLSMKYFWRRMHALGFKNPASPVTNLGKQHKIEKNFNKWIEKNRMMLICGHTHRFKYPKSGDLPYFNTGGCIYPSSITGIEITGGFIQLIRWRTVSTEDGVLQIKKDVLRGPDPISKFDIR